MRCWGITALLAVLALSGSGLAQSRTEITGAGATFPAPLVTTLADEFRMLTDGRITVNYQSIGSGGGLRQFLEQTIMFGATERFLSDEQIAQVQQATGGTAFNMPVTLGSVVPVYNLPGFDTGLVFSGEVLADMFLGQITMWNDPRLQELNPSVDLPVLPVIVAHRSDGSGTTAIWTDYLSKVSSEWAELVGFGTAVQWPAGLGGSGNEGVAAIVQIIPGTLGYTSLVYATLNDLTYGAVLNQAGNAIIPDLQSTTAAGNVDLPADARVSITDTPAPDGYPISGFAWLLVHENLDGNNAIATREEAEALVEWLWYTVHDGQALAPALDFARLPEAAVQIAEAMIRSLKWRGEPLGEAVASRLGGQ
jgi:phosphate transport system substrate-binding protein